MDGQPDQDKASHTDEKSVPAKLIYPFEGPPARGHTLEVAPGVHWIRMPLPYALDHINLWALDDGEGWAVVDTGTRTDETGEVWRAVMSNSPDQRPLTRVFVTHMHPDHVGMAGWFTRKFGVRLWMTRLEYYQCRVMMSDTGREAPQDGVDFYRRAAWSQAAIETYRLRFGNFGKHIHAMPDSYRRISDGEEIKIGKNIWRVVVGNGHSPEHACLYCPDLKVLVSGDQVLPRISSNVSVHPTEPDANPMNDWMNSLAKIRREVPEDTLVLPAHGEVFRGLHSRLDKLERGQNIAFDRLRRALSQARRVPEMFSALFARPISPEDVGLLSMATGETVACLNYLYYRGEISRVLADDGAYLYQIKEPLAT
jgi:glyoxylase-like metal-dependent hydrolase (beta-lactamase superfamily II)